LFELKKDQRIIYEFIANRDLELKVFKGNFLKLINNNFFVENSDYLLPKFKMVTPVLSEEGSIPIDEDTKVTFEVKNLSKMRAMKLKIAIMVL
jgi:hypothetical protein